MSAGTTEPASATPLVEVDGVTKRFPGVLALNQASLEIRQGEIHALLGENGARKSTLIKLLSGVYKPDAGVIRVRGVETSIGSPSHAQALGITTIHQEHTLAPESIADRKHLSRPGDQARSRAQRTPDAGAGAGDVG